jgi:small-conductance mechanosensitive channel
LIVLANLITSIKKLFAFVLATVIIAAITIFVVDFFIAGPMNVSDTLRLLGNISLVVGFTLMTIYGLSKIKNLLEPHVGIQASTILEYIAVTVTVAVAFFITLGFFGVSASALLTSAGIITVTVGLIISTFVGGILSGALVFTTYKYKIGDAVMVNNVPGKVSDMTALVMRIRTDIGQITIPNSAIASGGVILTAVLPPQEALETRLPYKAGDRVLTSFKNEEGTIKEVTGYHTVIQLDSGRELTFLNNSIFTGAVVVVKVTEKTPI